MYGAPLFCKRKMRLAEGVCANVFANKGEGVVKGKDIRSLPEATPKAKGLETKARVGHRGITFGVGTPPTINTATTCGHDSSIRTPNPRWCESAYSACRSGFR